MRSAFLAALAAVSLFGCARSASESVMPVPSSPRELKVTEAATQLEQITRSAGGEKNPAVSPDGKLLAYETKNEAAKKPSITIVSLDPTKPATRSLIYDAMQPAWLPDGSALVFVSFPKRGAQKWQVVKRELDAPAVGALLAPLGDPAHDATWPAISPDGKAIATTLGSIFVFETQSLRERSFEGAIALNALDGYGIKMLVGDGIEPSFSPDGRGLAFIRKTGGHGHVFVEPLANLGKKDDVPLQLTDGPDEDAQPTWSPDGKRVAFCSAHHTKDGALSHAANLFVIGADGQGLTQLTEGDVFACRPSWGKDGFLYFHADAGGGSHIWRLHVKDVQTREPPPDGPDEPPG